MRCLCRGPAATDPLVAELRDRCLQRILFPAESDLHLGSSLHEEFRVQSSTTGPAYRYTHITVEVLDIVFEVTTCRDSRRVLLHLM